MDFGTIWNIVQPDITVIVLAGASGVAAYLYQWAVQRLPTNMRSHIADLTDTAVRAIEQKYSAGSPGGDVKKQEAMQLLLSLCQSLKIPLDAAHASAAIDAAVFELNLFTGSSQSTTPAPKPMIPTPDKPTAAMPSITKPTSSKPLAAG